MTAPTKDRTVRDPHHDGVNEWKVEGRNLYHRTWPNGKWKVAKRVSFTPARILAIASIIDRCFLCDEPDSEDHRCAEWPKEDR